MIHAPPAPVIKVAPPALVEVAASALVVVAAAALAPGAPRPALAVAVGDAAPAGLVTAVATPPPSLGLAAAEELAVMAAVVAGLIVEKPLPLLWMPPPAGAPAAVPPCVPAA